MSSNNQKISSVSELESLLSNEWSSVIGDEFSKDYWQQLIKNLNDSPRWIPEKKDIFNALNRCPPEKVKVVLIGQDPYIHANEAHGYSFSVKPGTRMPPSLRNVLGELADEYDLEDLPESGCLVKWEDEGVLLLNSVLTVNIGVSGSHKGFGWENFTSRVIRYIDTHNKCCVFLAFGRDAQKIVSDVVTNNKIITAGHPSPRNTVVPFRGCNCFRETNEWLMKNNVLPVRWLTLWN